MAINNFQFPGVELTQEFVEAPVTGVSQLGVAVVGEQFYLVEPDVADTAALVSVEFSGSTTSIPKASLVNLDQDATLADDAAVIVVGGTFANYAANNSTSTIKITGSTVASNKKQATIQFNSKLSGTAAAENAFGTALPAVGDTVEVTAGTTTTIGTITSIIDETNHDAVVVATGSTIGGTSVTGLTFDVVTTAKIEDVSVSGGTAIAIPANATAKVSGKATPVAIKAGTYNCAVGFKTIVAGTDDESYQNKIGVVGSLSEIRAIFGAISVANPMALALALALRAARGNVVYFTAVTANSAAGFEQALDLLDKNANIYSIVPLTTDSGILASCVSKAVSVSSDKESKIRRTIWYGIESATAPSANDVVVNVVAARKAVGTSLRAQAVWADDAMYNGEVVPNYILAAAPAGMRSYEPTYRPISNLPYDFLSVKDSHGLSVTQLKQLGSQGIWIIDNNYDGTPINMRQITTAISNNINKDEESIVANADSIALTLCRVGENLVGCSNISPALLVALQDTLTGIMNRYLLNLTGNIYVGPQLLSWTLDALYQDTVQLDHIYATITCEPPKPFNRFVLTLRIV